jgi:hypothetical protein
MPRKPPTSNSGKRVTAKRDGKPSKQTGKSRKSGNTGSSKKK